MSAVFTAAVAAGIEETLSGFIQDTGSGDDLKEDYDWLTPHTMDGAFEDRQEMAGPGLLAYKPEGQEMATGSLDQGFMNRLLAKTYALKMIISHEVVRDNRYPQMVRAGERLERAGHQTVGIEVANMLIRGFDSNFVYGDGQPLFSTTHPLVAGSFSNMAASGGSPSESAVIEAATQIMQYPDHNGYSVGKKPKRVLCPIAQWATWEKITKASFRPEDNNFADVNVVGPKGSLSLSVKLIRHWSNTVLSWAIQTNAPLQPLLGWREKFKKLTWVENSQLMMCHGIYGCWGWTNDDPRAWYGNAGS